jgi:hypothetical protein
LGEKHEGFHFLQNLCQNIFQMICFQIFESLYLEHLL